MAPENDCEAMPRIIGTVRLTSTGPTSPSTSETRPLRERRSGDIRLQPGEHQREDLAGGGLAHPREEVRPEALEIPAAGHHVLEGPAAQPPTHPLDVAVKPLLQVLQG